MLTGLCPGPQDSQGSGRVGRTGYSSWTCFQPKGWAQSFSDSESGSASGWNLLLGMVLCVPETVTWGQAPTRTPEVCPID